MTNEALTKEIQKRLPDCVLLRDDNGTESIYGVTQVPKKSFRTKTKALINTTGRRCLFVSDVMYQDQPIEKRFRYGIVWTDSERREYRHKHFAKYQHDKVVFSGKTDEQFLAEMDELIQSIKRI